MANGTSRTVTFSGTKVGSYHQSSTVSVSSSDTSSVSKLTFDINAVCTVLSSIDKAKTYPFKGTIVPDDAFDDISYTGSSGSMKPGTNAVTKDIATKTATVTRGTSSKNLTITISMNINTSGNYKGSGNSSVSLTATVPALHQFTLSFNANGASGTMNSVSRYYGISTALPYNTYTKTGYTFKGWATTLENAQAGIVAVANGGNYTITANTTLYAVWEVGKYMISASPTGGKLVGSNFGNFEGGTSTATIRGTGNDGTPAAYLTYGLGNYSRLGKATRAGYLFRGWYSTHDDVKVYDANGVYSEGEYWTSNGNYNAEYDMDIYAKWYPIPLYTKQSNAWEKVEPYVKADNVWKPCFMDMEAINAGWAKITTGQRSQPWATIQSWVGLTNDTWSNVTACRAAAGDIVYLPCAVTDRNNLVGWFKLKVNSYSGTTLYTENQAFLFGFTYVKVNGEWKLIC